MPILMGYGAYWAISEREADILTKQTQQVLNSVPSKKRKAVIDAMNSYLPIVSLFSAIAIITYPRIMQMQEEKMNVKRRLTRPAPMPDPERENNNASNATPETKTNSVESVEGRVFESPSAYFVDPVPSVF